MRSGLRIVTAVFVAVLVPACSLGQQQRVSPRALELRRAINLQIQQATPAAKAQIEQIPKLPTPVTSATPAPTNTQPAPAATPPPPPPSTGVSADQKNLLLGKIMDFDKHARSEEKKFSSLATVAIIGIAALSLTASLLSFASRNKVGGILGLVVVAIVGITNTYPIGPLSDFYRSLAAQTSALKLDCDLKDPFTADAYNSAADQLKVLILYEADKRPQLGNTGATADELTQQLQVVKSSASH